MTTLHISDAAAATGVPATTLRYWEQAGLLHSRRTDSGYRIYDEHDLERLRFISAAKHLELPLEAIAELLRTRDTDTCATVKGRLRPMVAERLAQAEGGIDELNHLADTLRAGLTSLDALPDRQTPCDPSCTSLAHRAEPEPNSEPALACTLTGADHGQQLARWSALLADATLTRNGLAAHVTMPATRAGDAATLIVDEQACCPFLDFSLSFLGTNVMLSVTAANPEALPFVDALLSRPAGCG